MKQKISTISVALAVYNEEENITKCLESVSGWVNEIIVVDGSSTDNTQGIVRSFPNTHIIETDNKPMFHINKQMAIEHCHSDWILQLDADEVVSPELRKEIISILGKDIKTVPENGYWINRKNYFLSDFLMKGGVYPDSTIRLYKNGYAKLPCVSVHEQAEVQGKVGKLSSDLLHFADISFSRYLLRNNRYTSIIAQELSEQKVKISFISFIRYFLILPVWWFLKTYFRHLGFKDGFPGFVFSWYSSLRFPIAYIKYFELKHSKISADQIKKWF